MKKRLLALMMLAVMVLSTACGSSSRKTQTNEEMEAASEAEGKKEAEGDSDADTTEEAVNNGNLIYISRVLGDLGMNDFGWEACQEISKVYGYTPAVIEIGNDTATFENAFLDACDCGEYSVMVTQAGSGLSDYVRKYAPEYPEMKFIVFDMGVNEAEELPENAYGIAYDNSESCFVAGALAAKLSENKIVGIMSYDNPSGNDFAAGYVGGVKYAEPDCKVYYYYGMQDSAAWQEQGAALYSGGCNVILAASARFGMGVFNEAVNRGGIEAGYMAIGLDTDLYTTLTKSNTPAVADVIVSSTIKEFKGAIMNAFQRWEAGTLPWGKKEVLGLAEGGVGFARNDYYKANVPEDVQAYIEQLIEDIIAGKVEVPSFYNFDSQEAFLKWINPLLG